VSGCLLHLSVGHGPAREIVVEAELRRVLLEVLGPDPAVEALSPALVVAVVAPAVAQQEALDPLLGPAAVVLEVFACPDELAQCLLGGARNPDGGELAGAVEDGRGFWRRGDRS